MAGAPKDALPEFAFIGRSNVGKSSLINLLAQRRELALVSATPGKTRLLNFFRINNDWRLVDLPGYGYAKGAKGDRADFNVAVADYLDALDQLATARWQAGDWWGSRAPSKEAKALRKQHGL